MYTQQYNIETMVNGWTRIDMLLALYERAINEIRSAQSANQSNDTHLFQRHSIQASQYLLAIHSGLNTDGNEIAMNIARLLHFVTQRLEENDFDQAVHFLKKIQMSFENIREEATELEKSGKIPPLNAESGLNATA